MRVAVVALLSCLIGGCSSGDATTTTDGDEVVAPAYSGIYSEDLPLRDEGRIWQLSLRADGTFSMAVQGLYDCEHLECPTSRVLGQLGWTRVAGKWRSVAGSSQVDLRPTNAAPFNLTLALGPDTLDAHGTIGDKPIAGLLSIKALYGKDHPREKQLEGTWLVDTPPDADGRQSDLNGAPIDVRKASHFVSFDATTLTFREWTGTAAPLAEGPFSLGVGPSGKGVLVMESEQLLPNAATLDSLDGSKVELVVAGGASLHLTRQ
jgi:hypothetical protein